MNASMAAQATQEGGAIKSHFCASEFTGERLPAAMVALLFFSFYPL